MQCVLYPSLPALFFRSAVLWFAVPALAVAPLPSSQPRLSRVVGTGRCNALRRSTMPAIDQHGNETKRNETTISLSITRRTPIECNTMQRGAADGLAPLRHKPALISALAHTNVWPSVDPFDDASHRCVSYATADEQAKQSAAIAAETRTVRQRHVVRSLVDGCSSVEWRPSGHSDERAAVDAERSLRFDTLIRPLSCVRISLAISLCVSLGLSRPLNAPSFISRAHSLTPPAAMSTPSFEATAPAPRMQAKRLAPLQSIQSAPSATVSQSINRPADAHAA